MKRFVVDRYLLVQGPTRDGKPLPPLPVGHFIGPGRRSVLTDNKRPGKPFLARQMKKAAQAESIAA